MTNSPSWSQGALIGSGRFRIEAVLGSGGAGTVYRAVQVELNDQVAIKVSAAVDTGSLEALREEAKLLRRLRHPHLPQVIDFFVEGHWPCLVMEFIDGQDLNQLRVAQGGVVPEAKATGWIIQVADALAYLHAQKSPIVHRDIKPENIRVRSSGDAVLVDFGIAKVGGAGTQTRVMAKGVGTPPYAPPEQYGAGMTDTYTDVYALGATFYVLLTGQFPAESVYRQSSAPLVPPRQHNLQISLRAEQIILKAMAIASGDRFPSGRELLEALRTDIPIVPTHQAAKPDPPGVPSAAKTEVIGTNQVCPKCGAVQETVNPFFCTKCGASIALRFPQTGWHLTFLADLHVVCDAEWDTAVEHFRTQRLHRWLEARGEAQLLARVQQVQAQYPQDPAAALELLLRPHPQIDLAADCQEIDFGVQTSESRPSVGLKLSCTTPGYIHGTVQAGADWLTVHPPSLSVQPGQPIPLIMVGVKPERMIAGDIDRPYSGVVKITTNRGTLAFPVRLTVRNPPRPEVIRQITLGIVDACRRVDNRAVLRNVGGGAITGQVSARQPWLMVEAQDSQFVLRRGEQHTVNFSVDTRLLSSMGKHDGTLLWETDQGNLITGVQIEVTPPFEVSPHEPVTAIRRLEDLIRLCDAVQGGDLHAWERGVALLRSGRLATTFRFFNRDDLAGEAENLVLLTDINIGLEQLLRQLGAKPAERYKDNQDKALSQITGPLSRKPAEVVYGVLNTSKRGYLHGFLRPLVEWISIPEPHFGCLPGQEAIVKLYPDYARRARLPFFGSVALFEVVLE